MAHCLIHLSISHIPELRMKYSDILVKQISFAACKWSHSLSCCHRLAFRRDNLGNESAEHGVGALILDVGLDIHLRLCWSNLWRSNIGTVSCHMHIFEHMQPYIAIDALAIIPSAALRVSIIIAHGYDIRSLLQLVSDIELEVEITIRILAFAKLSVHIHLGITIYAFKLQNDSLSLPSLVIVESLAIPATPLRTIAIPIARSLSLLHKRTNHLGIMRKIDNLPTLVIETYRLGIPDDARLILPAQIQTYLFSCISRHARKGYKHRQCNLR